METIDWKNLPFGYFKTDYNIRCYYKNNEWSKPEVSDADTFPVHIAATSLHYGQEAFEGMKAYRGQDGKVRLFRWQENARRLQDSARGTFMPEIPESLFKEAISKAVELNKKYIPPYGTGATLYIRPLLIGTGPEVGVKPSKEYMFIVFVAPVGPYFKSGFKPTKIAIIRDSDRAAPLGTGNIKVGGNYAASLRGIHKVQQLGYSSPLYLDAKEKQFIDEIGVSNFFAIKEKKYITPESSSILPSITNKSLMQMAPDLGLTVERRPVHVNELGSFEEVGACGTAAIIAPIGEIYDIDEDVRYEYCKDGNAGPACTELFKKMTGIQFGEEHDPYNWTEVLDV